MSKPTKDAAQAVAVQPVHGPDPGFVKPVHGPAAWQPIESLTPIDRLRAAVKFPKMSTDDQVIAQAVDLIYSLQDKANAADTGRFLRSR
jgi:hypothetical protein